uniref:Uncharacterized protein n=1 Tax=Arundo donax TaxID=35708 RepID=A0A0A9APB3_ARUDO
MDHLDQSEVVNNRYLLCVVRMTQFILSVAWEIYEL